MCDIYHVSYNLYKTPYLVSSEFIFDDSEDEVSLRVSSSVPQSVEPPQITLVLRSKTVISGKTAKFACRYKSATATAVEWTKDGKEIRQDARHKLEHEGDLCALTILNVNGKDAGKYVVTVRNDVGHSRSAASLQIEGEKCLTSVDIELWNDCIIACCFYHQYFCCPFHYVMIMIINVVIILFFLYRCHCYHVHQSSSLSST